MSRTSEKSRALRRLPTRSTGGAAPRSIRATCRAKSEQTKSALCPGPVWLNGTRTHHREPASPTSAGTRPCRPRPSRDRTCSTGRSGTVLVDRIAGRPHRRRTRPPIRPPRRELAGAVALNRREHVARAERVHGERARRIGLGTRHEGDAREVEDAVGTGVRDRTRERVGVGDVRARQASWSKAG